MKAYKVIFRPSARDDLERLHDYIFEHAGWNTARDYIDRIEEACLSLRNAPQRGTRRNDIKRGLRVTGFERRAAIAFRVSGSEVIILRVFYGGQDYERILRDSPDA